MDSLSSALDIGLKIAAAVSIVVWWDRRMTRLETKMDEIVNWKNRLTSGGYPAGGN
jgi:hypothetical protein